MLHYPAERVRVLKDASHAYSTACKLSIDLHGVFESIFNSNPGASKKSHDLELSYLVLQRVNPGNPAFKKSPAEVCPFIVEGKLGNIWARYLGSSLSRVRADRGPTPKLLNFLSSLKELPQSTQ